MASNPHYQDNHEPDLFELKRHLGTGGFAHTYLVRVLDEELIEDYGTDCVAIKVPLSSKKQRVLTHEVELNAALWMRLRKLKSTYLCQYLGIAIFRGQIVMVMEYCPDGSLRSMLGSIGRQKKISVGKAVKIAEGVLRGLKIIHNEYVFHRDIKPENILMAGDTPKISDLGISKMVNSNEMACTMAGTIYYMSPEMLFKEGASFPSDIWSLGVTLYEMLTGSFPFGTRDTKVGELVELIRNTEYRHASEISPDIPRWLDDVIEKALAKHPGDRFHSADEMLKALGQNYQEDVSSKELAEIKKILKSGTIGNDVEVMICSFIEKNPQNYLGYHYLGQYYNRCQFPQKAVATIERGIQINPECASLHWDLALVLQNMGRNKEAILNLEKALSIGLEVSLRQPAAALLKVLKGSGVGSPRAEFKNKNELFKEKLATIKKLMSREDYDCGEIAGELKRLAQKYPDNPQAHLYLGEHLNRCQRHSEALEAFKKALNIEKDNFLVHWNIALACQRLGRKSDAVKHLKEAMKLDIDAGLRQHAARLLKILGEEPET